MKTLAAAPQGGPPVFTDEPLEAGQTKIKAVHVTELRDAVNQARTQAGLGPASWTDAPPLQVVKIKAVHIVELRARLDDARSALGMPAAAYTDPGLGVGHAIRAVHIQELRQVVTETLTATDSDAFVTNFHQWALLRPPSGAESTYWIDIMRAAYTNGQGSMLLSMREMGKTVFESNEYAARNRDNHWYVYDLYKTYLLREPDAPGWAFWENECNLTGRDNVRRAFDESGEFAGIVSTLSPSGAPSSAVSSLASARVDPFNQPGNGLAARDAEWSVPLLSLPGRAGLDLGLSLSYSSMVLTRSGPYIYFNEDNNFPSPGFRLGFPTIQEKVFDAQAGRNIYLLITSSGNRVALRQLGASSTYEAADSSYLQLIDYGSSLVVRATDGTQLSYSGFNNEWRCTQIKDRNGNYLTVNYDWLGHITTIVDALARTITFNYDTNANLISISQGWTVDGVPATHIWATFGWGTQALQSSFAGVSVIGAPNGSVIPVLTQVGLDDGSRYNFEYTSATQVNVIRRHTADNVQRAYTAYDYQTLADDCPRLSAVRVAAENWTGINGLPSEVTTQYSDPGDGSHVMTAPDGTIHKEFYGGTGASPPYQKGLVTQAEVWSGGVRQKWTVLTWTQDSTGVSYQANPRVTETNVYDAGGNRRRVATTYAGFTLPSGSSCRLPTDTREYAADASSILRRTHTDYRMDAVADVSYLSRHIIGLAKEQRLYEVNAGAETLKSQVRSEYDETGSIQGTDAPVRHDQTNYGASFVAGRGNRSSVKRYDVDDTSQFTISTIRYNMAGAVVASIDPLSHQTSVSYGDSFSDGLNSRNTLAYPTTVTDADGFSTVLQYNFDFGARTRVQGPPPEGQPQGLIQTLTYDGAARIDRVTTTNNGAYQRFWYGPDYAASFASINNVADEAYSIQLFDGLGRPRGAAGNHPGSDGGYKAQMTQYDRMGRVMKQSNPAEITGAWAPTGDDGAGWVYTAQTYDWQGRQLITTNTDGTTKEASYSGCGCAGGEVATLTDEGTVVSGVTKKRQQKIYSDVLGRTWKTEMLDWNGTGPNGTGPNNTVYSSTVNTYNARDQITQIRQYQGAEGSANFQDTTMTYDGHGRLKTRHLPQQGSGKDTVWEYNPDDTIQKITDARNASRTFGYNNNRHLVNSISYAWPGGGPVPDQVSFGYDAAGNRTSMTDGLGSAGYAYDQMSRMTSESRTFTGVGAYNLGYQYNLAGQLTKITDPFNAEVGYVHDTAGRVMTVTNANFGTHPTYASNIQYRASGAVKEMNYGNTRSLSMTYNARLQPATFSVPGVMSKTYDYQSDGRLKFSHDLLNPQFDRSYAQDHAGRITEALSGAEARNEGTTNSRPYKESFVYDPLGHLTARPVNKVWSGQGGTFSPSPQTYVNERNTVWEYDDDGNLTDSGAVDYTIDAAGQTSRTVTVTSFPPDGEPVGIYGSRMDMTQGFDGDGLVVKKLGIETLLDSDPEGNVTTTKTFHLLRSTVLGGKVVSEIGVDSDQRGFVYLGDSVLAIQSRTGQTVSWEHRDAGNASVRITSSNGSVLGGGAELDPLGSNAGTTNTVTPISPRLWKLTVYPGFGNSGMDGAVQCTMDYMSVPCDVVMRSLNLGVAEQCPENNCGPRVVTDGRHRQFSHLERSSDSGQLGYWDWKPDNEGGDPRPFFNTSSNVRFFGMFPGMLGIMVEPQKPKKPYIDENVLNSCTQDYFGVTKNNFKPSVSGGVGEFTGTGPSYLNVNPNGAGNNDTFTIRNNATTYSNSYLKFKQNEVLSALGLPPDNRPIVGLSPRSTPYVNYTGYDVKDPMEVLKTQIHELGHSLDRITQIGYDDRDKHPNKRDLGGRILEDCVRRRGGFRYK